MTEHPPETARPPQHGRAVSPANVFVYNLLAAGCLGYFKLGQKQKAWTALVLFLLLAFPTWCAGSLLVSLVAAVDGYFQACEVEAGRRIGQWTMFRSHYNG